MLAKAFLRDAERASHTSRNDLVLSQVVVDLHDAVDNLLGAVATHHALHLASRDGMVDAFSKIESAGHKLGNRAELDQLNVMRVAIKHQGVPQNSAAVIALLQVVSDFCNRVSKSSFGVTLDGVSLSILVENDELRQELDDILRLIEANDYKTALQQMGILRFITHQSMWIAVRGWWNLDKNDQPLKEQKWVFPDEEVNSKKLECLELGIDPDELIRFEWLTPKVGYDNLQDRHVVLQKESLFWHERNWSYENAIFCFNFLVSYLAAKQKSPNAPTVVRQDSKKNKVRFLQSSPLLDNDGNVIRTFVAGAEITCFLRDFVDSQWQNHGFETAHALIYEPDGTTSKGYVQKKDVDIGPDFDEAYR